jgi:ABC-type multidrug transport system fused ATPase/permease subunit
MVPYLNKFFKLIDTNKYEFSYILFISSLVSMMDVVGILSILPLVWVITDFENFRIFIYSYNFDFLNIIVNQNILNVVLQFSLLSVILFFIKIVSSIYVQYALNKFSYHKMYLLRSKILKKTVSLDFLVFQGLNKNETLNILLTTVHEFIELSLRPFLRIFSEFIIVLILSIILLLSNPILTICTLTFLFSLSLIYFYLIRKKIYKYGSISDNENIKTIDAATNNINGFVDLKILNLTKSFINIFIKHVQNYSNNKTKSVTLELAPRYLFEFSIFLILNLIIIYYVFAGNLTFIVQNIAMFAIISVRILPSISIIASSSVSLRFSTYHLNKLYKFFLNLNELESVEIIKKREKINTIEEIKFKNVNFLYENNSIFHNLEFTIKKNEFIGIYGNSGSGKSTFIKLLSQIIKPINGEILVNNHPANKIDLQSKICLITQNFFLINGSIKDNITLDLNVEEKIDDSLIINLLKEVNLYDELIKSNRSIYSQISQDGSELSGGQKQRLIIARSLFFNREFFIFDEAVSSLDQKNVESVIKTLIKLKNKITLIFITHNLNSLSFCDKIYKLSNLKLNEVRK